MMNEPLKIPDRAWRAAEVVVDEVWENYVDIAPAYVVREAAIKAAAPLIVAVELRRLAEFGLQSRHELLRRADELDPEGSDANPA